MIPLCTKFIVKLDNFFNLKNTLDNYVEPNDAFDLVKLHYIYLNVGAFKIYLVIHLIYYEIICIITWKLMDSNVFDILYI